MEQTDSLKRVDIEMYFGEPINTADNLNKILMSNG
jgi:hypothetical protein